jgi:hypothetical protein
MTASVFSEDKRLQKRPSLQADPNSAQLRTSDTFLSFRGDAICSGNCCGVR